MNGEPKSFAQRYEEQCVSGWVPDDKTVALLCQVNSNAPAAQRHELKKRGYQFEYDIRGSYKVSLPLTPEQKEALDIRRQMDVLRQRLAELER